MTGMFRRESSANEPGDENWSRGTKQEQDDRNLLLLSAPAAGKRVFRLGREWTNGKQETIQVANRQADAGN